MNRILRLLAAAALLSLPVLAFTQESNLNGRWTATLKKGDRTGTAVLTISISAKEVTGTLSDPSGQTWKIEHGKVDGNRITFDVTAHEHGTAKIIHFFGQMAEESITLENESNGRAGRTMTFQRVKY